jgi:hypothetical protein
MTEQSSFNKFENYPQTPYNCIKYLMDHNELIWKLLKYTDADAWKVDADHPNLTKAQKGTLIHRGQPDIENYRVFMARGQENAWTEGISILRISVYDLLPTNHVYGNLALLMESFSHYRIQTLSNYDIREDLICQQLIETLNGAEIENIGQLYFNYGASSKMRLTTSGQIPFVGKSLIMCNWNLG